MCVAAVASKLFILERVCMSCKCVRALVDWIYSGYIAYAHTYANAVQAKYEHKHLTITSYILYMEISHAQISHTHAPKSCAFHPSRRVALLAPVPMK